MIHYLLALIAITIANFSFGMKPSPQESLLETLGKQGGPYFIGILPRELIGELQKFLGSKITSTINSATNLEEAIKNLKELASEARFVHYFDNPKDVELMIQALAKKFDVEEDIIASQLNTRGAQQWLKEMYPKIMELFLATQEHDLEKVKKLIGEGVNVNFSEHTIGTPLVYAAAHNSLPIARYLIEKGADVNAQDIAKATPLIYASMTGNRDLVKLLLKHGADSTLKAKDNKTALDEAREKNDPELVKMLEDALAQQKQQGKS